MAPNTTAEQPVATLDERVATNVRALLAAQRKTSADLAVVLRMDQRAAQRRLRNAVPFTLSEVGRIATWLSVPVTAIITDYTLAAVERVA